MKRIMVTLVVLATTIVSSAQEGKNFVISAGDLKHIYLGDEMNVTLVHTESAKKEFSGDRAAFEKLNISVADGALHVFSRRPLSPADRVLILVEDIQTLSIGRNTVVKSENILQSKSLAVSVVDGSTARLRTTGKVEASSPDGYEVSVKQVPYIAPQRPRAF